MSWTDKVLKILIVLIIIGLILMSILFCTWLFGEYAMPWMKANAPSFYSLLFNGNYYHDLGVVLIIVTTFLFALIIGGVLIIRKIVIVGNETIKFLGIPLTIVVIILGIGFVIGVILLLKSYLHLS